MYKTLNMSTNVRSASRASFVAQFKQLTVLLALSSRSKCWCLVLASNRNTYSSSLKALQEHCSWLELLSQITKERKYASNEAESSWTFKKRIQNWPFATKCFYWSAKNHTNLLSWLLPTGWVHSGRIAEKLRDRWLWSLPQVARFINKHSVLREEKLSKIANLLQNRMYSEHLKI